MPPDARPTPAETDAILYRPDAAGLWAKATWQLIAGLLGMARSNWGAIDVILRIDAINLRELAAGRDA